MNNNEEKVLFQKNGIFCLKATGNPYKIGFQHGTLLKDYIEQGVYKYFVDYLENAVKSTRKVGSFYPLAKLVLKYIDSKAQKYIENIPREIKDEIRGLCDAAGLDYHKTLQSYVFPEVISYLNSRLKGNNFALKTHLSGAALLGCSSIITAGKATETGELIHGRNFDFLGIGYWEKFPLVSYIYPDDGYSYISVSSIGIAGGVVTGINEKGLTYAVHQNYTCENNDANMPILALGTLVLKNAANLEQAEEIIRESKATSGWSVVVTDHKKKDAFVAEICADNVSFRRLKDDFLLCTNSYIDPGLHESEIVITPIFNLSSTARYNRLKELIKINYKEINPEKIVGFLGDRYDNTSEKEKIFGYTVSQNFTISSVVFAPDREMFWVASGKTPVCNSEYIPFHTDFEKNRELRIPVIKGHQFTETAKTEALSLIMDAHYLYENNELNKALENLQRAIDLCNNEESVLYLLCGILYLKLGEFNTAYDNFQTAFDHAKDVYRSGVIKLWMGRALDLLKNREKAERQYKYVSNMNREIYTDLVNLGFEGLKKPYKKRQIKYINLDIWHGEELSQQ